MITFRIFILILLCKTLFAQTKVLPIKKRKISCDCNTAINITIDKPKIYGPTQDTSGFGHQAILKKQKGSKFYFEQEHNSAWYLIDVKLSGDLVLDIIPSDTLNDLDFILFNNYDTSFCRHFSELKYIPIRTNIARNKGNGNTGLNLNSLNDYAKEGVGTNYSKFLPVKEGDKLMLVVDNVSKEPKGHTLHINVVKNITLSGNLTDENNNPLIAELSLTNNKGKLIETFSSDESGNYSLNQTLNVGEEYFLNIYHDSAFVKCEKVDVSNEETYKNKKSILSFLKVGKKYRFENLVFVGGSTVMIPQSKPILDHLVKLMKKNPKLIISIEGHVNDAKSSKYAENSKEDHQSLSEKRAYAVYKHLLNNGIDKKRMKTIGYGATKMLFPVTDSEEEMEQNRRVEIRVISK